MLRTALLLSAGFVAAQGCRTAIDLIKEGEGYRSCMYRDTRGFRTICYGFNLDASGASTKVASVGANFNNVLSGAQCLSQSQCETLLTSEVNAAASAARSIFGTQCSCIMAVLTDLTYNLGSAGMQQFKNFIAAIKAQNWRDASYHLSDSQYCRQVGNRCTRNRRIIEAGCQGSFLFASEQQQDQFEVQELEQFGVEDSAALDIAMQVASIADHVAEEAEYAAAESLADAMGIDIADADAIDESDQQEEEGDFGELSEYDYQAGDEVYTDAAPTSFLRKKIKKVAKKVKSGYDKVKKLAKKAQLAACLSGCTSATGGVGAAACGARCYAAYRA